MKNIIFTIILILFTKLLFSQNISDYKEKIILNTDRTIYVSGETIYFSAQIINSSFNQNEILSKILYFELVNPSGKQIIGRKFLVNDSKSIGNITIPTEIVTGNYYLRAYTKYMRNFRPESYSYVYLNIVNPYYNDLANGVDNETNFKLVHKNDSVNSFDIKINKKVFSYREKVNVDINITGISPDSIINICTSVILADTYNLNILLPEKSTNQFKFNFLPETRGITLTGSLKDKLTDSKIPLNKINLSILRQKGNKFYSTITDSSGRFFFTFPEYFDKEDLFLSIEALKHNESEMFIDNDFCTSEISLPNPLFNLTKNQKETLFKIVSNYEVNNFFIHDSIQFTNIDTNSAFNMDYPFYGETSGTLYLNDYIQLPTLKDYFTELPFLVKIRKNKGVEELKILSNVPELLIYKPLVMVDFVSIDNIEDIFNIQPKNIAKIDVVTAPYVLGNIIYGGIINIISKKNDLAGIKLPKSGIFLNYLFLTKEKNYQTDIIEKEIPDVRNTLYWNPDLTFVSSNSSHLSFLTSDTPGVYIVHVTGTKRNGDKINSSISFEVKANSIKY